MDKLCRGMAFQPQEAVDEWFDKEVSRRLCDYYNIRCFSEDNENNNHNFVVFLDNQLPVQEQEQTR